MAPRESRLREFVRQNVDLILDPKDRSEELKKKKFEFFRDRLQGEVGMPRNTEIARDACKYLVDTERVSSLDDLKSLVAKVPFLRKNVYERDWPAFDAMLQRVETQRVLSTEDLRDMHRAEFVAKKEQELVDRAREKIVSATSDMTKQAEEEIERRYKEMVEQLSRGKQELAAEREALERVKSEIDAYQNLALEEIPYLPPESGMEVVPGANVTWWQRIGLFANPFPTVDGLSRIDERYHDSLVLKTPIFQRFLSLATSNPDEILNKTYLVVGEFGSGKTTLFDYLKKPILTHDILPVHLLIDAEADREATRRSFYRAFVKQVAERFRVISQADPRSIYDEIGKEELLEILQLIVQSHKLRGVVVMLDGLHKNEDFLREALGFIQILQNTKDYWIREGLNIGFMIAGSRDWERELNLNPAVKGSIYRIDPIPGITAGEAYDMISKRFATFSKDAKRPAKVRRAAVEKLHNYLGAKYPREITFRDVVEEVLPYLERNDLGYVEISIPFDKDLLTRLRDQVNRTPDLKARIDKLRRRPDAFLPALQILSLLLEKKRALEKDELFKTNRDLFAMLSHVGLIQKVRSPESGQVGWIPSRLLVDFGRQVELQVGLKPSEFLVDIFREAPIGPQPVSESEEVLRLRSLISTYRSSDNVLGSELQDALDRHVEILNHASSPEDIIPNSEICPRTRDSLDSILRGLYLVIEPRTGPPFAGKTTETWLLESWISPEEVFLFWQEVKRCGEQVPEPRQAAEVVRTYLRAFRTLVALIELMLRANSVTNLSSPDLKKSDKVALHQARSKFVAGDFFGACRTMTDYMEQRLRGFLYDFLTLKYGDKWRARLGPDVNQHVMREKGRSATIVQAGSNSLNDLYYCARQHYRQVILEVPGNWSQIFESAFIPERKDFVDETLHLIFALGDKDKHNLTNEYFRENSDKLLLALQGAARILTSVNRAYQSLISTENVFVESTADGSKKVYFSFKNLEDKTNLVPVLLTPSTGNDIAIQMGKRLKKSSITLDIADHDSVEYAFGRKHRETLSVLAYAMKEGKVVAERAHASLLIVRLPGGSHQPT